MAKVKKIISIIFISVIVKIFIELKMHRYYLTDDNFISEYGIINKNGYRIQYDNIESYSARTNPIDRILNTHTVNIIIDEGTEIKFRYVPKKHAVELDNRIHNTQEPE